MHGAFAVCLFLFFVAAYFVCSFAQFTILGELLLFSLAGRAGCMRPIAPTDLAAPTAARLTYMADGSPTRICPVEGTGKGPTPNTGEQASALARARAYGNRCEL